MIHNIKKIAFVFQVMVLVAMLPTFAYLELSRSEKQLPSVVKEKVEKSGIKLSVATINKSKIYNEN